MTLAGSRCCARRWRPHSSTRRAAQAPHGLPQRVGVGRHVGRIVPRCARDARSPSALDLSPVPQAVNVAVWASRSTTSCGSRESALQPGSAKLKHSRPACATSAESPAGVARGRGRPAGHSIEGASLADACRLETTRQVDEPRQTIRHGWLNDFATRDESGTWEITVHSREAREEHQHECILRADADSIVVTGKNGGPAWPIEEFAAAGGSAASVIQSAIEVIARCRHAVVTRIAPPDATAVQSGDRRGPICFTCTRETPT